MASEPNTTAPLQLPSYYLQLRQEYPLAPTGRTALHGMGNGQGMGSRAGGSQLQLQAAHKLTHTGVKQLCLLFSHASSGPSVPARHPLPSKGRGHKQQHLWAAHHQGRHKGEQEQEDGVLSQQKGGHPPGPCSPAFLLPFHNSARTCHFRMHQTLTHLAGAHHTPSCTLCSSDHSFSTWGLSPHGLGGGSLDPLLGDLWAPAKLKIKKNPMSPPLLSNKAQRKRRE